MSDAIEKENEELKLQIETLKLRINELRDDVLIAAMKYNRMKRELTAVIDEPPIIVEPHGRFPLITDVEEHADTSQGNISYTPLQLQNAYRLNYITTPNNSLRGTGIKIAVVIAYHYSGLQADFNRFCTLYSLPPSTLQITNLAGTTTNKGWALEECLDVQMIKTAAPGATIMVVEARTSSLADMKTAVATAVNLGADIVSMSWGTSEFSSQSLFDSVFNNNRVCYVCSSGDTSQEISFPSSSSNVLGVGGTSLILNSSNQRTSETVWRSAGGGISSYISKPSYQSEINLSFCMRSVPDICAVADPNTGVKIICSLYGNSPLTIGGTSASCPFIAGFLGVVNQLRVAASKQKLTTVNSTTLNNNIQKFLYTNIYNTNSYGSTVFDIVSGINGYYTGAPGYDIISGVGSIIGDGLCTRLVSL